LRGVHPGLELDEQFARDERIRRRLLTGHAAEQQYDRDERRSNRPFPHGLGSKIGPRGFAPADTRTAMEITLLS
jgi:hypothetical protein